MVWAEHLLKFGSAFVDGGVSMRRNDESHSGDINDLSWREPTNVTDNPTTTFQRDLLIDLGQYVDDSRC